MSGQQPAQGGHGAGGPRTLHFHMPFQLLLGVTGMAAGALYLLKVYGTDYAPFLPDGLLATICAVVSVLGCLHMVITKIFKPRMIF